eukprot:1527869-Rhodomonas_salina.3
MDSFKPVWTVPLQQAASAFRLDQLTSKSGRTSCQWFKSWGGDNLEKNLTANQKFVGIPSDPGLGRSQKVSDHVLVLLKSLANSGSQLVLRVHGGSSRSISRSAEQFVTSRRGTLSKSVVSSR